MHSKTCVTETPNPKLRCDLGHMLPLINHIPSTRPLRIAFYSHDTMGMGHIRRNLLIASAVVKSCQSTDALLIAGTREAAYFATQAGLDCVTLPALVKRSDGTYSGRNFDWTLENTTRLRSCIIKAALEEFAPDVFVVDKLPKGVGNELVPTLELLKTTNTRCVLGLRDVLDEPTTVAKEWLRDGNDDAIESYFDELWIYGDQTIYDCLKEYDFSQVVSSRAFFTGYLNQSSRHASSNELNFAVDDNSTILCVVGGGQDGFELAETFAKTPMPSGKRGVVITGPFMPKEHQQKLHKLAMQNGRIEIIDRLVETDDYLRTASRVVAMGGYNTVTSILSYGKPALIVPRMVPRQEQWIRAQRLAKLGLITAVPPQSLSSQRLSKWLTSNCVPAPTSNCIDLYGLNRISQRVGQWVNQLGCSNISSQQPTN